jgi:hypothetical protein
LAFSERTLRSFSRNARRRLAACVGVCLLISMLIVSGASASVSIEGVWSFNSGQIAIKPEGAGGKFEGVVVSATKFGTCVHPVGQRIWTGITPRPDGSYWGFHQWYFETSACVENTQLGLTAWRVEEPSGGARQLRVCLSEPGKAQPTIPSGSPGIGASFGCVSSARIAALPTKSSGGSGGTEKLSLPNTKQCVSLRHFQIHLRDPAYDPFKEVVVSLRKHTIAVKRHGRYIVASIDLRGFPVGVFTLHVRATTVLGHHLTASRTYHTCVKKSVKSTGGKK